MSKLKRVNLKSGITEEKNLNHKIKMEKLTNTYDV